MHGGSFAQNGGSYACRPGSQSDHDRQPEEAPPPPLQHSHGFDNGRTLDPEAEEGTPVGFTLASRSRRNPTRNERRAKAAAKAKTMLNEQDMFESTRPPATTTADEEEEQPPPPAIPFIRKRTLVSFISCPSWDWYCKSCDKGYQKKDPSKEDRKKTRKCPQPQCRSEMVTIRDYLNGVPLR